MTATEAFPEVLEALEKLWQHTPKIDHGRCEVCRIGYAKWEVGRNGELTVGRCDNAYCLSLVVRDALDKGRKAKA